MTLVGGGPRQQIDMPALDLRRYIDTLISAEGVGATGDLAVTQNGTPNMTVNIAAGTALVKGDIVAGQGYYLEYNDATYNLPGFAAAHATLPRIDRVVLRARDAYHGDAANDDAFVILTGTATSGATLVNLTGAAAVGNSQLLLANVLIPAAATTVTTANIGNVAAVLSTTGTPTLPKTVTGIIPAAGTTATAGTGFTYTHTNATGIYVVTFTVAFAATPVVQVTTADGSGYANVTSASASGVTVNTLTENAAPTDHAFHLLAYTVA